MRAERKNHNQAKAKKAAKKAASGANNNNSSSSSSGNNNHAKTAEEEKSLPSVMLGLKRKETDKGLALLEARASVINAEELAEKRMKGSQVLQSLFAPKNTKESSKVNFASTRADEFRV